MLPNAQVTELGQAVASVPTLQMEASSLLMTAGGMQEKVGR